MKHLMSIYLMATAMLISLSTQAQHNFINSLKAPYTAGQIDSAAKLLQRTDDHAFLFFRKNRKEIDAVKGARYTHDQLTYVIFNSKIKSQLADVKTTPDWTQIEKDVKPYGILGKDIYLRAKAFHYKNQKNWPEFIQTGDAYLKVDPDGVSDFDLNNWAWDSFLNVSDPKLLVIISKWSLKTIANKTDEAVDPWHIGTYANILYRLGKKSEAITAERRALALAVKPDQMSLREEMIKTIKKMEAGEPTWTDKQ